MTRTFQGLLKNIMAFHRQVTGTTPKRNYQSPRSVHRRYFSHTLCSMLLCTLAPVIILGAVISAIMIRNLNSTSANSNYNILSQFQSNMENIMSEINYMNIQISVNSTVYNRLKKTMTSPSYSYYVTKLTPTINSYLIPLISTRNYIDSMYIYMDNPYGRYVSVPDGLCWLNKSADTTWLDGYLNHKSEKGLWCIPRQYRKYSFLPADTKVISIYQKFYNGLGVSIINLSTDYFEQELKNLNLSPGQIILAVNNSNQILFSNTERNKDEYSNFISSIPSTTTEDVGSYKIDGEPYYVVQLFSSLGNLRYISFTPYASLHASAYQFYRYLFILILFISILCFLISYIVSRQFYQNITGVISILGAAEKGEIIPDMKKPKNLYGLLMQNITHTYVQQNMLKMQLKENAYQNTLLELRSLQSQISPHFLFNTLKSIFWMSFQLTASNNKVCEMIENMTDILDYSLTDYKELVTFSLEIRNTRNYIDIQRVRHNYQFSVAWDYDEELLEYRSLKLLLQPLVENCIIHAFTWEKEHNLIKIRIREKEGVISASVIDNGIGISAKKLMEIRSQLKFNKEEGHIGILNCNRRLALTFGSEYGVTLKSREGMGTMFTITFPAVSTH